MTWADWGALCLALIDWRQRYDVVEMDFDVFRVGDGRVGGGILKITKLNGDLGAGDGVSPL